MIGPFSYTMVSVSIHILVQVALIIRVLIRPHRDPASRIAWVAVIAALPAVGILSYLLFGEVSIGRRRVARMRQIVDELQAKTEHAAALPDSSIDEVPQRYRHLFRTATSISEFEVAGGNSAHLLPDSDATIDSMVADIDAATDHVHLLFYIWLPDHNGCKVVDALIRAAQRGVRCRAMADDLGSRKMIRSQHWIQMRESGVRLATALKIGNPLLRPLRGRIDLRNHRKIVVVDGNITYCGSQNCADPAFLVKAKYAPWVDAVARFVGPIAGQNQFLFASDWMAYANEDISELLQRPVGPSTGRILAQVIGTGPTVRYSAMPEMFESLFHAARQELVISTPYYVPDDALQGALCAAAYRGVKTTIIFPARNDSWIVGGASRSYYRELLDAGVEIYEFVGGLLHTKSLTLDGEITLIGSANLDRRSFDLNYENNIMLCDRELTAAVRERQQQYIASSNRVTREMVEAWSLWTRLKNNTLAVLGPLL